MRRAPATAPAALLFAARDLVASLLAAQLPVHIHFLVSSSRDLHAVISGAVSRLANAKQCQRVVQAIKE